MSLMLVVMGVPYGPVVLKNRYLYDGVALPAPLKEGVKKVWTFSLLRRSSSDEPSFRPLVVDALTLTRGPARK